MNTPSNQPEPAPNRGTGHLIRFSQRRFLKASVQAALAAPFAVSGWRVRGAPNSRLQHASIGVGGMGWVDLHQFLAHPRTEVVALCDVDTNFLDRAAKEALSARRYRDWRELLEREGDRIDSVNVTVPDHMHYAIARSAIDRGKHVYCQKPLCHDVAEVRALSKAATRAGVVTQLGTQMAAGAGDRTTIRWLQEGRIGAVRHLYMCSNRPGAVEAYRLAGPRPSHGEPPPPTLAWDLWLGTAPARPYVPGIYHPVKWRSWQDFGTGWSGDIGCHIYDAVWKGLTMQAPRWVEARVQASWLHSPERRADTWPQANWITWQFPGNRFTGGQDFIVEWVDGEFYPPEEIRRLFSLEDYPPESVMIVGEEGALLHTPGAMPHLLPKGRFAGV